LCDTDYKIFDKLLCVACRLCCNNCGLLQISCNTPEFGIPEQA
jgi:hypothetical protein